MLKNLSIQKLHFELNAMLNKFLLNDLYNKISLTKLIIVADNVMKNIEHFAIKYSCLLYIKECYTLLRNPILKYKKTICSNSKSMKIRMPNKMDSKDIYIFHSSFRM